MKKLLITLLASTLTSYSAFAAKPLPLKVWEPVGLGSVQATGRTSFQMTESNGSQGFMLLSKEKTKKDFKP